MATTQNNESGGGGTADGGGTANDAGSFSNVAVEIPTSFSQFAPQQFKIVAGGQSSIKSADAPFTLSG